MKRFIPVIFAAILLSSPANAECDREEAATVVQQVIENKLAVRHDDGQTVTYTWYAPWHRLSFQQKNSIANGLTAVEECLRPGTTMTLRFAGKDVARGNAQGVQVIE